MGLCQCNGLTEMNEEAAFLTQCYCNVDLNVALILKQHLEEESTA